MDVQRPAAQRRGRQCFQRERRGRTVKRKRWRGGGRLGQLKGSREAVPQQEYVLQETKLTMMMCEELVRVKRSEQVVVEGRETKEAKALQVEAAKGSANCSQLLSSNMFAPL